MPEDTGGEKTLPATPQKKQRAREDGNVAKSQDLSAAAALTAALLALYVLSWGSLESLVEMGRYYFANAANITFEYTTLSRFAYEVVMVLARTVLPFAVITVAAGLLLNFLQVGFLLTTKPLMPKLDKINPITGFKRLFSIRSLFELVKNVAKLSLVGYLVYLALWPRILEFPTLMELSPLTLLPAVADMIFAVWWRVAAIMLLIGIADFGFQIWQHERDLRMSVQEVRQETKEMEGDPQIKRRVRQLQRQLATQRMMADVPQADVIITNPTHYAVALRYHMVEMEAPVVVAKGARLIAQRIRELGEENDVPIVQKPELARFLHRTVEIGDPIPNDVFQAVAEVLSFVYQIDHRAAKRREREQAWGMAV